MAVYGYVRVSTQEQASSGLGLEDQVREIKAYCSLKSLDLPHVLRDEGVSASKPLAERTSGAFLVSMPQSGDHVVIHKLDRAWRNAADCLNTTAAWDKLGVTLHLLNLGGNSIDLSTPMGRMFLTMTAAFAELERGLISERTKAALAQARLRGVWVGKPGFGFKRAVDKSLEPVDSELATLDYIVEQLSAGIQPSQVAFVLNRFNVLKRGTFWTSREVRKQANRWTTHPLYGSGPAHDP